MTLQFEQFQGSRLFFSTEFTRRVLLKEAIDVLAGTIEDHVDVSVPSGPGIFQELARTALVTRINFIAKPIESGA